MKDDKHRDRLYIEKDYNNKLLLQEKRLIIKALKKYNGDKTKAHQALCPKNIPYSYPSLLRRIRKHNI